ncbi:MAG: fumarate hydratase [Chitinivibrionales bacterium]|nr:fumarate hydratase [Chitinivibrionales bacterium]
MRHIHSETIVAAVKKLCTEANVCLPIDVVTALQTAAENATSERGKLLLNQCLRNAAISRANQVPLCQDTGSAVFFVEIGTSLSISGISLNEAIEKGVAAGYVEGLLRPSIVADPLYNRTNTQNNTPAFIHCETVPGESLKITLLPKGAGAENMSRLAMLSPSDGEAGIIEFVVESVKKAGANACPPLVIGVGIGATAEKCLYCAKKALIRPIGSTHIDPQYSQLEMKLLTKVNETDIGAQGFGGTATALAVHIETFPCHIASLPVAVNLQCHVCRRASCTL